MARVFEVMDVKELVAYGYPTYVADTVRSPTRVAGEHDAEF